MKIKKTIKLYNDNIGYVSLVDYNVNNYNDAKKFIADCASVTRGKIEAKNYESIFRQISKESGKDKPGRPFEFIGLSNVNFKYHQFIYQDVLNHRIYSNLRNFDGNPDEYTDELFSHGGNNSFKIITGNVPYFVYQQLRTHSQIAWMAETVRVKNINKVEFWNPDNNDLFYELNQRSLESYKVCKEQGYKDEISARELSSRRYVKFIAAAWANNPLTWDHLVLERTKKATQEPTREVALAIKQLLKF